MHFLLFYKSEAGEARQKLCFRELNPCKKGFPGAILPPWASGGIGIHDGLKIRPAASENAMFSGVNGDTVGEGTLKSTLDDAKTSQIDSIRVALAGLSRDDLIAILADVLTGKDA